LDSLPPSPPAVVAASPAAPGDIFPRDDRERDLCARASQPDWLYLGGLALLDAGTVWAGSSQAIKYSQNLLVRSTGPIMIGLAWGATLSGTYLSLPKCSSEWVGESPREGRSRPSWPLELSVAILAGATAPIISFIAIGYCSDDDDGRVDASGTPRPPLCQQGFISYETTFEREMRLVIAGAAGVGGALLPYLLPPKTVAAARELDRLRFGVDGHGGFVGYSGTF
jgi:hypothetical protein